MTDVKTVTTRDRPSASCAVMPLFVRLKYFYGQLLGARDLQIEQAYFRNKHKLHNRCLHGHGVVCGLVVEPAPVDDKCAPRDADKRSELEQKIRDAELKREQLAKAAAQGDTGAEAALATLDKEIETLRRELEKLPPDGGEQKPTSPHLATVSCGLAIDCAGDELVVSCEATIDLLKHLDPSERRRVEEAGKATLYVSVCYHEQAIDPVRPVVPDECGGQPGCVYGKARDGVCFRVSVEPPKPDERCEPCCTPCPEPCVLLARVAWEAGRPLTPKAIDNAVRRPLSLYQPTVITGVSWLHGATYTVAQSDRLLGTRDDKGGLEIHFSRPVLVETLTPGVVELWRVLGGGGLHGPVQYMDGQFVGLPGEGTVKSIRYRNTTRERMQLGDRLMITLRGDFILDECCQPLAGTNVGGRVPQHAHFAADPALRPKAAPKRTHCLRPPPGIGPWTSGLGRPGGAFESWFFIEDSED